jgi:hypothetical protein
MNKLVERLENSNTTYGWINRQNQEAAQLIKGIENVLKDDSYAASFQTLGQYRKALLDIIKDTT